MPLIHSELHRKIYIFSILAIVLSLPFSMLVNNISIMLMVLNWLFETSFAEKWKRLKKNHLAFIFIFYFLISILGLLYTSNFKMGMFQLEKQLAILVFPLVLSTSDVLTKLELRKIFQYFILSCFIATIACFVYAIYRNYQEGFLFANFFKYIFFEKIPEGKHYLNFWYFTNKLFVLPLHRMHHVYFAMYLIFCNCLLVWLWAEKKEKSMNIFSIVLLFYNFFVVLLLLSRTQFIIIAILSTGFVIHYAYFKKKIIVGTIFFMALFLLGYAVIKSNPFSIEKYSNLIEYDKHYSENKYGEGGFSLRLYKWKYALETILRNPWIGTGTGDMQDELQKTYIKNNFEIGFKNYFNPHNQYLQSALELGLIGFSALIIALFFPAYIAYRRKKWLYLIFIFIFSVSCITESMLEVNKGIIFYSFFNSLFAFHLLKSSNH